MESREGGTPVAGVGAAVKKREEKKTGGSSRRSGTKGGRGGEGVERASSFCLCHRDRRGFHFESSITVGDQSQLNSSGEDAAVWRKKKNEKKKKGELQSVKKTSRRRGNSPLSAERVIRRV